jgi:hypothetical protein
LAVVATTAVACQPANQRARPVKQSVQITVIGEDGAPIASAVMTATGNSEHIEISGTLELKIDQPVAGTIEAPTTCPNRSSSIPQTARSR